jgi:hypothetical protein
MPYSATMEILLSEKDPTIVHLERLRSQTIPPAITTASLVLLHSNPTLPVKPIRPLVTVRYGEIRPATSTRRVVFRHSSTTPLVAKTQPPDQPRLWTTPPAASTPPPGRLRSQVGIDPDLVTINSNGRLGRANVSSRRYKHNIQPIHTASKAIYDLKPVSFRYDKQYDPTQTVAFGLIAEEVAEANPDLVGRNPEGLPESVRYEQINAMLLNDFLKEHRKGEEQDCKIQKQDTTIAELRSEIGNLTVIVNEQASELRKVSAELQTSNAALRAIATNP